jgi:hypothetical protein
MEVLSGLLVSMLGCVRLDACESRAFSKVPVYPAVKPSGDEAEKSKN